MNNIFDGCRSIVLLPDISKWNIKKLVKIGDTDPLECCSLSYLPNCNDWCEKYNEKNLNYDGINIML